MVNFTLATNQPLSVIRAYKGLGWRKVGVGAMLILFVFCYFDLPRAQPIQQGVNLSRMMIWPFIFYALGLAIQSNINFDGKSD